jgi:hypothetical protein
MLSNAELDAIEAKAGRECKRFVGKGGTWEIVVRSPTETEWEWYLDRREKPQYKTRALKDLLTTIVVFPTVPEFQGLCEKYSGIAYSEAINLGIQDLMGMIAEEVGKK